MNNNINNAISQIMAFKKQGMTPQAVMQMLFNQNPQYQQMATQLKNMAGGRNMNEFVMQMARQNGVTEENLKNMQDLFRQ